MIPTAIRDVSLNLEVRQHRVIDFDVPPVQTPSTGAAYASREVKENSNGVTITERRREGDVMVINVQSTITVNGPLGPEEHQSVKTMRLPAVIDFQVLLDAVKVEEDDHTELPWHSMDGWEHQLEAYLSDSFTGDLAAFKRTRGFVPSHYAYGRVVVTDESFCGDTRKNRFTYYHNKGASKQVARELVASEDRRYVAQIVKWYAHYREVYVSVEIKIGGRVYEESCGGYDEDYGQAGARTEIAGNLIYSLEKDGYTIVGYDRFAEYNKNRNQHKKDQLERNLHMFDWKD